MSRFVQNKWKYSTIGLLAILAVGFSFPQAFAHITNSLSHNVGHILDAMAGLQSDISDIKAVTDSLPADIATESDVQAAAEDVGIHTAVHTVEHPDPGDGAFIIIDIIEAEPGKAFSGHVSGKIIFAPGPANAGGLICNLPSENFALADNTEAAASTGALFVNEDFTCTELVVTILDPNNATNDPAADVFLLTEYVTVELP